jgi:hypothetical protein
MELDNYIWGEEKGWQVGLKQLWDYLAQYVYLPRLDNRDVLLVAVRDGVRRLDAPFAYATGQDAEGYHTGVLFRTSGQIYFDENSLLIHPEHIREREPEPGPEPGPEPEPGPAPGGDGGPPEPEKPKLRRFYGRVEWMRAPSTAMSP